MSLWITSHCKKRYVERINDGKPVDVIEILKAVSSGKDITDKIYTEAPRYILYLYEEYGGLGLKIVSNGDIIFILKKKEGTEKMFSVITCFKNINYLKQFKETSMSREDIFIKIKIAKSNLKKKNQ